MSCYWSNKDVKMEDMVGQTFVSIVDSDDEIRFVTDTGKTYLMHHQQDCCEGVSIESIVGDLQDLIGTPILKAEEATSGELQPWEVQEENGWYEDSFTWTFYKFATIKGYVDIRWYGSSNGYYSESVDFIDITDEENA